MSQCQTSGGGAVMHGIVGTTHAHIGINGPAIEYEDLVLEEDVEVGPWEELWGDLATSNSVNLGVFCPTPLMRRTA